MNWKNVLRLISAEVKSYRLVGGERFRRFRESSVVTYAMYIGACVLGAAIGCLFGSSYKGIGNPQLRESFLQGTVNFLISIPTLALLYSLVFTQMRQIQRMEVKASSQPLYWFPITWEEHTLASMLTNLLGAPSVITLFIISGIIVASVFLGLVPLSILTIFALLVSSFMASASTEVIRVLQVRVSGAMTKVAGRKTIWVRFLGTILFFIVFYAAFYSLFYQVSPLTLLEIVAGGQRRLWFIPYVWPGITLAYFASGLGLETGILLLASIGFLYAIFLAAVRLNIRFGLYEAPPIRVSQGDYVPRVGILERLGFSPLEAAMIRKDFKAFTRRSELMYIFIFPIILTIMPLISFMRGGTETLMPQVVYSFLFAYFTVIPGTAMVMTVGSSMVGLEGGSIWYVCSSPITTRSLVKAKYSFAILFSLAVTLVCSIISGLLTAPSIRIAAISLIEVLFLTFSLGMVSLSFGIKGADFRELPRPRIVRPKWIFINFIVCGLLVLAIVLPILPYAIKLLLEAIDIGSIPIPEAYIYAALPISGIIASIVTYGFYRRAVKNIKELLSKAEG